MNRPAMPPPGADDGDQGAARVDWRALALVALPPVAVLALRALLPAEVDGGTLQRLQTATLVSDAGEALWMASRPLVYGVLALGGTAGLLYALVRRLGWARVRPLLLALWLLLWAATGVWLLASERNRAQRQALPAQPVKVLLAREILPGKRTGPGGTEVYFELAGEPRPLRLFAQGLPPAAFVPGSMAMLHAEAGRWWGRWGRLTSRLAPPAAPPAAPAAAAPAGG